MAYNKINDPAQYEEVVRDLNDPTSNIKLKIEYLMSRLSPQARTFDGTTDWVRIRAVAKRFLKNPNPTSK
jgi:hypothetical protein